MATAIHRLEFYLEASGRQPVREWLMEDLTSEQRRTVGAALFNILQQQGINVCESSFGRQLGGGLFEFRLREEPMLVRIFCHAYGDRVVLLLGGYDKARDPSDRRQEREIATARTRLEEWRDRQRP
jgi:phage-related protein